MPEEQSVRSKRYVQANQIRIIDQECVNNHNQVCANNGTSECYQCAIFAGDIENPIKYVASWKTNDIERISTLSTEELSKPPQLPSKREVIEEDIDIPHFTKFIQYAITHQHSGSIKVHKHYICDRLGDNCILCGAPVVGTSICNWCETSFNGIKLSGNGLRLCDDRTVVCDLLNKRFIFV